jgi:hypothetical protein
MLPPCVLPLLLSPPAASPAAAAAAAAAATATAIGLPGGAAVAAAAATAAVTAATEEAASIWAKKDGSCSAAAHVSDVIAKLRRSLLSSRMPDMSCSSHIMPAAAVCGNRSRSRAQLQ